MLCYAILDTILYSGSVSPHGDTIKLFIISSFFRVGNQCAECEKQQQTTTIRKDDRSLPDITMVNTVLCLCFLPIDSVHTSSSLDVPAGVTQEEGHAGFFIFHPPSFCGACLNLSREKDSVIPFPRRP